MNDAYGTRGLPFGRPLKRPAGARLPVTVISGYLGAGKTTLIQKLMTSPAAKNTAVIVNEFADIGIDSLLLKQVADNVVLLGNGCLCCRVDSDLHTSLMALKRQRTRGEVPEFEQIVLETSGLADPLPILQTFLSDRTLQNDFYFRGLVTLVDAACGTERPFPIEARNQIAFADRLVITKSDLVASSQVDGVIAAVRKINSEAEIGVARNGNIEGQFILGDTVIPVRVDKSTVSEHQHEAGIAAFTCEVEEPVSWAAFAQFIESLTAMRGPDLLRVKGVVNVVGSAGPVVVQLVQHIAHPPVELQNWTDDDRRTRLVFITRNIPKATVTALFQAIRATAPAATA